MKSLALDGALRGLGLQAEPASARLAASPLTGVTAVVDALLPERSKDARPIEPLVKEAFSEWLETQSDRTRRWAQSAGFKAEAGSICLVPGEQGELERVLVGVKSSDDPFALGALSRELPEGDYYLDAPWSGESQQSAALGWALGAYQYTRYRDSKATLARLCVADGVDLESVNHQAQAIYQVRDLINTPPEDMMPGQLACAVEALGQRFGARVNVVEGDGLLAGNLPIIHAVGRASHHLPRLVDLQWGDASNPKVTLVGKGVCFDSGGLDIKTAAGMRLMKKDMGGAAHAIGLAHMIMAHGLPVRLRLLIPAVENAVSGNAYHPGDVLRSRKGISVEIHNTDAEGRLVMCDALTLGGEDAPELMFDFSTLTGAARVALGPDLPAMFCNDDELSEGLLAAADEMKDPVWRMPLFDPYREMLDSKVADIVNAASNGQGGAITAALFLKEFVPNGTAWAHFDLMAWNSRTRPGRPEGGEAMGLRAVFKYLQGRYGT
ncbi:MAG: leucyl aminopeptidase family protein [Pseudomonadales bacterium]